MTPAGLSPASSTAKPPGASISSRATSLIVKLRRQVATFSRTGGRFSAIANSASSRAKVPISFSFRDHGEAFELIFLEHDPEVFEREIANHDGTKIRDRRDRIGLPGAQVARRNDVDEDIAILRENFIVEILLR